MRFQKVVGLKLCEEMFDFGDRFPLSKEESGLCSYIWQDSPWLDEFNPEYASFMLAMDDHKVTHYVFFGGDSHVEILTLGEVKISQVSSTP